MRMRFYFLTRDLHLYIGLFLSPFVLLFAVSVILMNHPGIPLGRPGEWRNKSMQVEVPPGLDRREGMERVQQVRPILQQAGISGEVGFIFFSAADRRLVIPVSRPGYEATLALMLDSGEASIKERKTGFWDSLIYLHKLPGPHLVNIRGNWLPVRLWAYLADGTAWLMLFLSVSGVYLWAVLRSERRVGSVLIGAGIVTLLGALYVICR
jgi:hypothetical protein